MSIMQMLLAARGVSAYLMDRSVRFRSSASAYLNRTPASAGDRKTWTWSGWVKRGNLGATQNIFMAGTSGSDFFAFQINPSNQINVQAISGGVAYIDTLTSAQVLRDVSAWYHMMVVLDLNNATQSDRCRIYLNGNRITSFATNNITATSSQNFEINNTIVHAVGRNTISSSTYVDLYLADLNFIDGQALDPTSFGETNALTGVWQPIAYTGTYGTNGFYLDFEDTSSVAALGADDSGNGNTWTVNNISLTAGVTYDSMTDVPTLTSATTANYAVLNPLSKYSATVLSEANLKISGAGSAIWYPAAASIQIPTTGKYFCEFTIGASDAGLMRHYIGIITDTFPISTATGIGNSTQGWAYFANDGGVYNNGSAIVTLTSATTNDVIGVAFDSDAGTLQFYKNGSAMGSALTGFTSKYYFAAACFGVATGFINFGQRPFAYTPPTGFVALNTFNLAESTIVKGGEYFNPALWTGNGTTQNIDVGFQPDFVWHKTRSTVNNHVLLDSVRGEDQILYANLTNAEASRADSIALTSTGYNLEDDWVNRNGSGITYVGWNWKAGGAAVTNTDGTISAQISANPTAGFSVVTFTGTGANATVGHGLGVAPNFIIIKNRSAVGNWFVYQSQLPATDYLQLNSTAAQASSVTVWNNTAPTSSVFSIGTGAAVNGSGNSIVAYCWAEIAGFSKFGKYIGNGNADGTFIYTGFKPKWVMIFKTSGGDGWVIYDTSRDTYNVEQKVLSAQSANAESTLIAFDGVSNGFKIRTTSSAVNTNAVTYVYMAFAENPFRNSLAR